MFRVFQVSRFHLMTQKAPTPSYRPMKAGGNVKGTFKPAMTHLLVASLRQITSWLLCKHAMCVVIVSIYVVIVVQACHSS